MRATRSAGPDAAMTGRGARPLHHPRGRRGRRQIRSGEAARTKLKTLGARGRPDARARRFAARGSLARGDPVRVRGPVRRRRARRCCFPPRASTISTRRSNRRSRAALGSSATVSPIRPAPIRARRATDPSPSRGSNRSPWTEQARPDLDPRLSGRKRAWRAPRTARAGRRRSLRGARGSRSTRPCVRRFSRSRTTSRALRRDRRDWSRRGGRGRDLGRRRGAPRRPAPRSRPRNERAEADDAGKRRVRGRAASAPRARARRPRRRRGRNARGLSRRTASRTPG